MNERRYGVWVVAYSLRHLPPPLRHPERSESKMLTASVSRIPYGKLRVYRHAASINTRLQYRQDAPPAPSLTKL